MPAPGPLVFLVQDVDALGGSERQALALAGELARAGSQVLLLTSKPGLRPRRWLGGLWPEARLGVELRRLPQEGFEALAGLLLRGRRPALIYGVGLMLGVIGARLGRLLSAPAVVKLACSGPWGDMAALAALPPARRREVQADLARATLVCLSAALEEEARAAGFLPQSLVRIPNGVDLQAVAAAPPVRPLGEGARCVLFAGRLDRQKGVDTLIEAFAALPPALSDARLLLAGVGPEEAPLRALAHRRLSPERVRFLGRRPDVPGLLRGAAVACLPSRGEGMSNLLLEALAAGTPLVASDIAANREVTGEEAALLVRPDDPAALAAALARALDDADLRARLSDAGRERARAFDLSDVARAHQDLFARLRAPARGPGSLRWAARYLRARGAEARRRLG